MKKAIVTGCTGQDGSFLVEQLLKKGYYVVGLKRRSSSINTERIEGIYTHPNFKVEYFDLKDASSINKIVAKYKPDEYYNLAAQSHVRVSFDIPEETMSGIINGTLSALEAIKNISPSTRFYQASSSEMYGDNANCPEDGYDENSNFCPASPYAVAKVAAHNLVRNYRKSYGLHASCGILFNHESERRGITFVTRKITSGVAKIVVGKKDKLTLGNLYSIRDWGYAPEYTEMMWKMLQQDTPDDYVISTSETHTVEEFLKETFRLAGINDYDKFVEINSEYFRPHEVPYLKGNSNKAKQIFGWDPKIKFKDLAKIMYEYDLSLNTGEVK
jgi:GDPmannose 4,6-dehydratase